MIKEYDAIVIGAGQAGIPLAKKLAKAGKKVALVEKRWIGGTCINDGCSPTKTMIASARVAHLVRNGKEWGAVSNQLQINYQTVLDRKNDIIQSFRGGAIKGLKKQKNLTIIYGEASFIDDEGIAIKTEDGEQQISGKEIFINTGCKPVIPNITGIHETDYLTSTTILDLQEVPADLLIVGGGYIALEFGQMMRRFGANVTIFERGRTLLPHEDDDVCEVITEVFKKEKIAIYTNAEVTSISGKDQKTLKVKIDGKLKTFKGSHILMAVGREPQTKNLRLSFAGIKTDEHGYIKVNHQLRTNKKHIYALGDVKGGPAFTQVAYNDHYIIIQNLLKGKNLSVKDRIIPYCMFTDPQLGRVGINEMQAKKLNLNYTVAKIPMKHVARALETGETSGYMKAIVDNKSKQILGAAIVGTEGGEIMSVLQMAMVGKITYDKIRYMMFGHPLFSESLNNLFMSFD